jgi:hypothetical protein
MVQLMAKPQILRAHYREFLINTLVAKGLHSHRLIPHLLAKASKYFYYMH